MASNANKFTMKMCVGCVWFWCCSLCENSIDSIVKKEKKNTAKNMLYEKQESKGMESLAKLITINFVGCRAIFLWPVTQFTLIECCKLGVDSIDSYYFVRFFVLHFARFCKIFGWLQINLLVLQTFQFGSTIFEWNRAPLRFWNMYDACE